MNEDLCGFDEGSIWEPDFLDRNSSNSWFKGIFSGFS